MAIVYFTDELRALTGGRTQLETGVRNYRELLVELDRRFPGLRAKLEHEMSVAIDGEIIHEPLTERIAPDSEVHFLIRISGG